MAVLVVKVIVNQVMERPDDRAKLATILNELVALCFKHRELLTQRGNFTFSLRQVKDQLFFEQCVGHHGLSFSVSHAGYTASLSANMAACRMMPTEDLWTGDRAVHAAASASSAASAAFAASAAASSASAAFAASAAASSAAHAASAAFAAFAADRADHAAAADHAARAAFGDRSSPLSQRVAQLM